MAKGLRNRTAGELAGDLAKRARHGRAAKQTGLKARQSPQFLRHVSARWFGVRHTIIMDRI